MFQEMESMGLDQKIDDYHEEGPKSCDLFFFFLL